MQNKPQSTHQINFSEPSTIEKLLDSKNPVAHELATGIIQRHNEDAATQRRIRESDATAKRWQSLIQSSIIYIFGGVLIIFIGIASYSIMTNTKASADEKSWARTTLTSLATGVIDFLFGKQGAKEN